MKAYCYASGEIAFGRKVPEGALQIIDGPAKVIKPIIEVVARHAYDGDTLLVPGIPEAADQFAGIAALRQFRVEIMKRMPNTAQAAVKG